MPGPLARRKPGRFEIVKRTTEGGIIEVGQKRTTELSTLEPSASGTGNKPPSGGRGTSSPGGGPDGSGPGRPTGTEMAAYTNQYNIWQQIKQQISSTAGSFKNWWNARSPADRVAWIISTLAALGIPGWILYEWLKRDADVDATEEMKEAVTKGANGGESASPQRTDIAVVGNLSGATTGQAATSSLGSSDLIHVRDVIALIRALRCEHDVNEDTAVGKLTMEYDIFIRPKRGGNYVGGAQQDW